MTPRLLLSRLSILFVFAVPVQIQAQLPVDPTVVHGAATIDTAGHHMTVTNSPNTILNWQSFSVGPSDSIYFNQQDVNSQVLNRVTGGDPSEIFGHLGSNGGVWLINPYGVLFGPDSRIDAASLVASTLDISNIDFLASRNHFNAVNHFGEVRNQGEIRTTFGGRVWLMGDSVTNENLVQASGGQVVLAAGESVEFVDSGAPHVVVRVRAPENETVNLGALVASNGNIDLHGSIVNQEGFVRANSIGTNGSGQIVLKASETVTLAENSTTQAKHGEVLIESDTVYNHGDISGHEIALTADAIVQQGLISAPGGEVVMQAENSTYLNGQVDVSEKHGAGGNIQITTGKLEGMAGGALHADGEQGGSIRIAGKNSVAFSSTLEATGDQQGGKIEVTGDSVVLLNADVNASGGVQGGTVHLGGGWQGSGDLPHAREVIVGVGSEVKANGNDNGGEIAVWSSQNSEHYGSLQALNGGRVELSSEGEIRQTGEIVVGKGGEVLFDPKNLIITDNPPDSLTLAKKVVGGSVNGQPALNDEDQFGFSVALDGDRLAVGAVGDDTGNTNAGAVYLFTGAGTDFSSLTLASKLDGITGIGVGMIPLDIGSPALGGGYEFGTALALNGDHLAVGAPRVSDGKGNVYLFSGVGNDFSGLTYRTLLDSQDLVQNGFEALDRQDFFGFSVALNGDRLVVGADRDDGVVIGDGENNNINRDFGAVYFFSGINSSEITPLTKLDINTITTEGIKIDGLSEGELFGRSIALDGDRLVVGAPGGIPDNELNRKHEGKVYLFTGVDSVYSPNGSLSGLELKQTLSVANNSMALDLSDLSSGDGFGFSVALQNNHLLVGAPGDDTEGTNRGKVYLFTGAAGDFSSGLVLTRKIPPFDSEDQPVSGDFFGGSVAIDGDRFAVGAYQDDTTGTNQGAAYLFTGLDAVQPFGGISIENAGFESDSSNTSYITPATLQSQLNFGSNVTLQANNDITVESDVIASCNVEFCDGGDLTLQAGRNIAFNADISTDNGDLIAVAGDPGATQEVDPGTPTLTIADTVNLDVGAGKAELAAVNGNFINNNGDAAISTDGGRWLIYAADPTTSTEGFAGYNKHYNQVYIPGSIPNYVDESGNWFFYSIAPALQVSAPATAITYGEDFSGSILTAQQMANLISGYIDGDSADNFGAVQQDPDGISLNASGPFSSSGHVTAGTHDLRYVSGLASDLGYQFVDNTGSVGELTVNPETVDAVSFVANDKVYDGAVGATIADGVLSGVIEGDIVSLAGEGVFDTKNVGVDKTVNLANGSLSGADSGNYSLSQESVDNVTALADITPKPISVGSISAEDKVYDGTTVAKASGGSLIGVVPGDSVSVSSSQAVFDNKNVGINKTVIVSGLALEGIDRTNYSLNSGGAVAVTADITPKSLTVENIAVQDKVYDGTTDAQLANSQSILGGVVEGDDVSFSEGAVAFETKNAGDNKSVIVADVLLTGADSSNYTVEGEVVTASSASITPKALEVESFSAEDKIYDGELTATILDGTLSGVIEGDAVSLSGEGAFNDKNVGTDKPVMLTAGSLAGQDSGNYTLDNIDNVTASADITPRSVTVGDLSTDSKTYNGNVIASVIGKLNNLIFGDDVSLTNTATFDTQDTGENKTVTVTNFLLNGEDSTNYTLNAPNSINTTGRITPATLIYHANPATRIVGGALTDFTGNVTGFVGREDFANATTGTLIWETTADSTSPEGQYPILGGGLSARNYQFIQDSLNNTALKLQNFDPTNPQIVQPTSSTAIQAVNVAAAAAMETKVAMLNLEKGGTLDVASSLAPSTTSNFGRINLAHLNRTDMQLLIDYRRDFKEKLFADSIYKLELDPSLADVPPCESIEQADLGLCRISDSQRKELKEQEKITEILQQSNKQNPVISMLPAIEKKLIVLFGVNQYDDKTIPPLDNSIADAEVLGQLFAEQLGYEIHIVKNATKAEIVRTLNQLSTKMEEEDSVVIYYAGHGYLDKKTGNGYWIPSDALASDPASWISNSSISEMLAGISSKQMVMISDSCYSGAFTKEQKLKLTDIDVDPADILAKRTVVVMSSGGDEPVADEGRNGHSIFAWFLMQALRNIDTWKIGTNIFEQVQTEVSNSFPQTPQYGAAVSAGHEAGGDYLFEFRKLMGVQ